MNRFGKWALSSAVAAVAVLALNLAPAQALDHVVAAKSADVAWTFVVLDTGMREGIFAKYGIDVEITALGGDAKVQQALAAKSIDFGLGSGPSMAFVAKGAPVFAVAAFAAEPRNISVVVGANSPIKTVADLKGKLLAVTTAGSLTDWLAHRLAVQEGWGKDGVKTVALGGFTPSLAALRTGQIDGIMAAIEAGYGLEERGDGKVLVGMEKYAPKFITHVVYARKDLIADKPDLVNRFLKGFFATIAFEKANKAKTTEIAMDVLHQSKAVMDRTYDYEISMFEDDGHFDPAAVEVIKDSFVEMGILDHKPPNDELFTTQFVPVKP
ncbi:MAG TPA: ABC transporter substrate-binding protein [Stellaceae bacterium]|jgi:ABC-type nitrate/sulfonate/bicarbonate transport system substrate-binding protein